MIVLLKGRSLIEVSGADCQTFLQSQFSNDIKLIKDNEIQFNAYCQHQGKIISIVWVLKNKAVFYLSIPSELKEKVLTKLNMFKMMAQVEILDISSDTLQYGLIDEKNKSAYLIKNNLSLLITKDIIDNTFARKFWDKQCVDNQLPEIFSKTSERFTPQELNLDINEFGVSFTKGCYPGQEVVARMHYLGAPKRRLFQFSSKFEVSVGDSIDVEGSKSIKPSGEVIRLARMDGMSYLLGTLETKYTDGVAYLDKDPNKSLKIS